MEDDKLQVGSTPLSEGLTSAQKQELVEQQEGIEKSHVLMNKLLEILVQDFHEGDLLRVQLIGTFWELAFVSIDWFPSKTADELLEELFKPIIRNEKPKLRRNSSSGTHKFFQFVRAVECCRNAFKLGNSSNQKRRDKAWMEAIEAFSYYVDITEKKPHEIFSKLGKMGADRRHAPMRELEVWTLAEYRRGIWKSANQAAHDLKESVIKHSRTIGAGLTPSNAQRTIADWINKDKKRSSR